ncbi:MAG TPA: lysozyme [Armatimonadota bacterium]|nr:lysozyme [Armatimonadota bacterium]
MPGKIEALLILHEAERLKPYRCPSEKIGFEGRPGKLTIGVGRNLDDLGITRQESRYLLTNDIARVMLELDYALPWWSRLSAVRRAVLMDMYFNIGMPRLKTFRKMLAALEAGDIPRTAAEMKNSKWYRDVGNRAVRLIRMMETDQWPPEVANAPD